MISLYIRGLSHVRWLAGIPLLGMIIIYRQCIPFTLFSQNRYLRFCSVPHYFCLLENSVSLTSSSDNQRSHKFSCQRLHYRLHYRLLAKLTLRTVVIKSRHVVHVFLSEEFSCRQFLEIQYVPSLSKS